MAEDKSHMEQGQIERAQRLRRAINELREGRSTHTPDPQKKSLKEQIEDRARTGEQHTTDSE